jgi:hypothetical protein
MSALAGRTSGRTCCEHAAKLLLLLLAALSLGCSSKGAGATGEALVTVDPSHRFQTIIGWEAGTYLSEPTNPISPQLSQKIIQAAVEKAGITRVRLEIRSGVESRTRAYADHAVGGSYEAWQRRRYLVTNDNPDPRVIDWAGFDFTEIDRDVERSVIPLRNELARRGQKLFINVCYVAFVKGRPNAHDDPEEYAEFALATMLHLRQKYGLKPDTWEVILEPDLAGGWSGRRIGRTILATSRRFAENGIPASFVAPSTMSMSEASRYFDDLIGVQGALPLLSEISYHRYAGVSQRALSKLTDRSTKYHIPLSMLELWFGRAGPDVLFEDLEAGAAAFQGRVIGDIFVNAVGGNLTLNNDMRFNSAVFRAVRPGAVRIGASSSVGEVRALAFRRPQGGIVTALRATAAASTTIRGLPAGNYVVTTVTDGGETDRVPIERAANGDFHLPISGSGVAVIEPR